MEKKSLLSANWFKAAFLLVALCFSGLYAHANTTQTNDLGMLVSGETYDIPANTNATAEFSTSLDGTITIVSSVDVNTNLVPFTDKTYETVITTERNAEARSKTFAFTHNQTVYFKSTVSATPYQVTFYFERNSNKEDYLVSIDPEEGEVNSLKEFTITTTKKCYGMISEIKAYLYKGEEKVAETTIPQFYNKSSVTFAFENEITEPGDYTLVIPEDSFQVGSSALGWNSEWRFNYTVVAPQPKMNVSIVGGATEAEAVIFNNLNGKVTFENTTATIASEWTDFGIFGSLPGAPAGMGTWYVHYTATKVSDTEYTLTPNADELAALDPNMAYQFKIPEGYFTYADGSKSPAYETWVKYEAPQVSDVTIAFSPVGGTEDAPVQVALEDLSNITLTLTGAESVAISSAALAEGSAIRLRAWVEYLEDYSDAVVFKPELVEGTTYKLVPFDEYYAANIPFLSSGKYELNIPAGTFVYNGEETNVNLTTTTYYNLVLPTYTILPEPDSTIEATETEGLMQVQIRFNNEASVTPSQTVTASLKKDGVVVEEGIFAQKNWAQQNMAYIWFSKTYTESGEYEVVLPEGYVTLGSGAAAEAMTIKYTVVGSASTEPTLVVTPEGGTEDAPALITNLEFTVKAENATKLDYKADGGWIALYGWGEGRNGEDYVDALYPTITRVDDTTVKFTFDNYSEELTKRNYKLSIPAGDMWFDGDESKTNSDLVSYYVYGDAVSTDPAMVITPANGAIVEIIDNETFVVTFENVENVTVNPAIDPNSSSYNWEHQMIAIVDANEYIINWLEPVAVEGEPNKFKLVERQYQYQSGYQKMPIITAGTYGIYMAAGAFVMDGENSPAVYEINRFTVTGRPEPTATITPAKGTTVEVIDDETFVVTFENVSEVTINEAFSDITNYIGLTVGSKFVQLLKPEAIEGEPNKFKLVTYGPDQASIASGYMDYPITTEGTYGLYIKAGSFYMDGTAYPAERFWDTEYITVGEVIEPEMVVTPENGATISSYNDIQIAFEDVATVEINPNALNVDYGMMMLLPDSDWMKAVVVKPVAIEGETNKFSLEIIDGTMPETMLSLEFYMEAGAFVMDGTDSPEIDYIYTVGAAGEPTMVLTPEAGTSVKAITSDVVTISFENVNEVTVNSGALNESSCKIMFMTPEGGYARVMPVAIDGETNKFRLVNFDGTDINLTTEGTYGLWIVGEFPQPAFYMDGTPCPSFYEANYITVSPYTYVADPAEGYVSSIKEVALTFDPGVQGMNKDAAGDVVLYKDGEEVEKVSVDNLSLVGWDAVLGSSLVITFSKEYTDNGEYKIVVPANVVELNGAISNKEITLNYTIGGMVSDWTAVADPAPGVVDEISTVWVKFEGASQIAVSSDAGPNDFPYYGTVAEDGTVTKVPYGIFSFVESSTEVSLTIQNEAGKITEPGNYAIIIPATYCTVDGVAMTEDIRFDYTIEGAQPEYTAVINPADGSIVNGEQLYVITVTFEGAKSIELDGNMSTSFGQIDENGNAITSIYQTYSVEGNVATFSVMELHKPYLDTKGQYRFSIPVGMVTITDNNDVVGKNKDNIEATYDSEGASVDTIGVDAKDLNIYSVNGMLIKRNGTYEDVKALESGVYIINGKKYYVK